MTIAVVIVAAGRGTRAAGSRVGEGFRPVVAGGEEQLPGDRVFLLQRQPDTARHQTGRGPVHRGVSHLPGFRVRNFCYLDITKVLVD